MPFLFHSQPFHRPLPLALFIRKNVFLIFHYKALINFDIFCSMILNPSNPISLAFLYLFIAIWTSFVLAEQICIAFLLVVKSRLNTMIAVSYILAISLALASGTVRSYKGLQPWLQENTKATHTRYASMLLHSVVFLSRPMNCTQNVTAISSATVVCPVAADYLYERLGRADPQVLEIL